MYVRLANFIVMTRVTLTLCHLKGRFFYLRKNFEENFESMVLRSDSLKE